MNSPNNLFAQKFFFRSASMSQVYLNNPNGNDSLLGQTKYWHSQEGKKKIQMEMLAFLGKIIICTIFFIFWCLMSLSTIFQLYRGGKYLEKTTDLCKLYYIMQHRVHLA